MELKLNIYEGNEVVKTYTAQSFRLSTGVVRGIIKFIDVDKFVQNGKINEEKAVIEAFKIITKSFDSFVQLLMDIFPDLTEEESDKTDIMEVAQIIVKAVMEAFASLNSIQAKKK